MKRLLVAMFVALLMSGCGEQAQKEVVEGEEKEKAAQTEVKDDPSVPLAIPCVACGEKVSKKTTECRQCGHPTPDSVIAFKKMQELARVRAEEEVVEAKRRADEERKREEELARIQVEEKQKLAEEDARKVAEEKRRLAEEKLRLAEEAIALEKRRFMVISELAGSDDPAIINKFFE
mgnify:CR=1 FL=1